MGNSVSNSKIISMSFCHRPKLFRLAQSGLVQAVLALTLVASMAAPAQATVINEADIGDFGPTSTGQTVFELREGVTTLSGSLLGSCTYSTLPSGSLGCVAFAGDVSDRFAVSISAALRLDSFAFSLNGSSSIFGLPIYEMPNVGIGAGNSVVGTLTGFDLPVSGQSIDLGVAWTDIIGSGSGVGIDTVQATYSFIFETSLVPVSAVPLPAGFWFLSIGAFFLLGLGRKRNKSP